MRLLGTLIALSVVAACGTPEPETPDAETSPAPASEIRAFGNEPFWSVLISEAGGIVYSRLGEEDVAFPYDSPSYATRDALRSTIGPLENAAGEHTIEIVISEEPCQDTMADTVHPMKAIVVVDGEELRGCARRPGNGPAEVAP
jgi:uncharacterized membrane protein